MTTGTQDNFSWLPDFFGDDDSQDIELFKDSIKSSIQLATKQRKKYMQVTSCIYNLTQANLRIPISVKEIIKGTNLSENELLSILTYLENTGFVKGDSIPDVNSSFYITCKGKDEIEYNIGAMLKILEGVDDIS